MDIREMLRQLREGESERAVARALQVSRKTVRRYRRWAEERGLKPLARIVAHASIAQEPEWFTTAPAKAAKKVLERAGMSADQVDLYEVNEAFAVVAMAAMRELELPHDKINPLGGAVALGHPIGASGARILATLLTALEQRGLRHGCASICIGGGEAAAMIVERLG